MKEVRQSTSASKSATGALDKLMSLWGSDRRPWDVQTNSDSLTPVNGLQVPTRSRSRGGLRHAILSLMLLASLGSAVGPTNHAFAEDLEPRQVPKTGPVDVPAGMHLVTDRAGLRWLLPEGMETPPERDVEIRYFRTRVQPREKGRIRGHVVLDGPLSAQDTVVTSELNDRQNLMSRLPRQFAEVMRLEKVANLHAQTSNDLRSLGVFAPGEFTTFRLPYIPIPEAQMEFAHVSDYATRDTQNLVRFEHNGRQYVRFFIHPNHVNAYADLIQRHGIVYHYHAMTTSSPRSLIVMEPGASEKVHWIKVSIHREIDGSVRINTDKKARRAIIMSEAIQAVPQEVMRGYGVQFMLEPAAFQPPGKLASTIHREVAPDLLNPARNTRWIPAFILQNTGENAVPDLNIRDMSRLAGERPMDFVRERIIRPLLRSYLAMGIMEGLPGELHTQNFYYQLRKSGDGWLPTGQVMFKDNDGFRFDTEMAIRQGRPLRNFAHFPEPFVWGKFSNAIGTGAEGVPFLGSWYYKLIRNVNGFETLSAYLLRAVNEIDPRVNLDKDGIQRLFDTVANEEALKLTGLSTPAEQMGFGKDKGLNYVLNRWRAYLANTNVPEVTGRLAEAQDFLAREFTRLRDAGRVSPMRRTLSQNTVYIPYKMSDGQLVIEARTTRTSAANPDPVIGFALLEPPGENAQVRRSYERITPVAVRPNHPGSVEESQARVRGAAPTTAQLRAVPAARRCETIFTAVGQ